MKQKTTVTTNDVKVIAALVAVLLLIGFTEAIADTFATIMCRIID